MIIERISGLSIPSIQESPKSKSPVEEFSSVFGEFIGSVNKDQLNSSEMTKKFISGEGVEIHEVMIAGEKAKTSLELLMEIRNKTIDMYRELTRMSV
ncbi:MAG: flagellar hook-basal body complex protein FliE [Ignavibacterium sp.]|nr:flagellar hook-basal body complex protein FliE [Ignavibacterium sp.]MCX7612541.1 flagellar hook-basal body complex protein FliE [Ignavibacterium sp.]MDW8374119.1 flagellar hook-basal body complex protein FliE [Ignavibacteriales bacterium]